VALSAIKLLMLAAFMLGIDPLLRDRIAAAGVGGRATIPVDLFVHFGRPPVWNSIRPNELQLPGSAISASATTGGAGMDATTR
ncbi:MAG: hypothetical protein ACREO4_08105, partial [Lysobacter sp.]